MTAKTVVIGAVFILMAALLFSQTPTASIVSTITAVGAAASGSATSGNPVLVAGRDFSNVARTFQTAANGAMLVGSSYTAADGSANTVGSPDGAALAMGAYPFRWNGATWDREYYCSSSAAVSVTAGNTTEIVALSGSTIIRVCGFSISASANSSTAKWVRGTGTNCGTGTADITAAYAMSGSQPFSSYGNPEVFRAAAGNALCLTAVTGNITGVVSYARY